MFYISDEVREELKKEENRSELINKLLKEHYSKTKFDNLSKEEILKAIAIKKLELETAKKIEVIENDKIQN